MLLARWLRSLATKNSMSTSLVFWQLTKRVVLKFPSQRICWNQQVGQDGGGARIEKLAWELETVWEQWAFFRQSHAAKTGKTGCLDLFSKAPICTLTLDVLYFISAPKELARKRAQYKSTRNCILWPFCPAVIFSYIFPVGNMDVLWSDLGHKTYKIMKVKQYSNQCKLCGYWIILWNTLKNEKFQGIK